MKPRLQHLGLSLLAGTAALCCAISPAEAADKKPNILAASYNLEQVLQEVREMGSRHPSQ